MGAWQQVKIWIPDDFVRHYVAETLMNVTLNQDKQTTVVLQIGQYTHLQFLI